LVLTRWWALRTNGIGSVTDACGTLTLLLSTSCVNSKKVTDKEGVKKEITRIYTMAVASLQLMTTRKGAKEERERAFLGKLTDFQEDKKAFERVFDQDKLDPEDSRDKPMENTQLVWGRIKILAENLIKSVEADGQSSLVHEQIAKACEGFCTQRRYLGTQLPFRYVFIIHAMANLDMALYVFRQGPGFVDTWFKADSVFEHIISVIFCMLSVVILFH